MPSYGEGRLGPLIQGDDSALLEFEFDAELTNTARRLLARSMVDGIRSSEYLRLEVTGFSVGIGGVLPFPGQYTTATLVNPDAVQLENQIEIYGGEYVREISQVEHPNETAVCFYCELNESDANNCLSEIGIWGKIAESPNQYEVDQEFLVALAHFPIICKNGSIKVALRISVQF